jgi:phosphoenolpyruvate carboxykinase (ATP)
MVRAALDGRLGKVGVQRDAHFGLYTPEACPDIPSEVLTARRSWSDQAAYDVAARGVAQRFETNFRQFEPYVGAEVKEAGIHAAA